MKTFKEFNNINESKINEDSNGLQGVKEYRDGLTPETVMKEFPWLLKAKFKDAVIGLDEDEELAWYDGIWEKGTWENVLGKMVLGKMVFGKMELGKMELGKKELGKMEIGFLVLGMMELGKMVNGILVFGLMELGKMVLGLMVIGNVVDGEVEKSSIKRQVNLKNQTNHLQKNRF